MKLFLFGKFDDVSVKVEVLKYRMLFEDKFEKFVGEMNWVWNWICWERFKESRGEGIFFMLKNIFYLVWSIEM